MLCSLIWRCIRLLVVLFPVALYTGHAVGQAPAQCPNLPATRAPAFYVAAEQTHVLPDRSRNPDLENNHGRWLERRQRHPRRIGDRPLSIWRLARSGKILGRPAFPFIKAPVELDLVVLSVSELGFGDLASLHDIYARAVSLGFELCPAEVGPALRLNYFDQPLGEFLHIAMKPVAKYNGELVDFTIGNGGNGLLLLGGDARRKRTLPGADRFEFRFDQG